MADREEEAVYLLGDLNSHLGYLRYQEENRNGKMVNGLLEDYDLVLLNVHKNGTGTFTWERGKFKSMIDL